MTTSTPKTKTLVMPDMSGRYPPIGNPPDGYVVTYDAADGYYIALPPAKTLVVATAVSTPYSVGNEDVTLVSHAGIFTVNLPTSPLAGTVVHVKDFSGNAVSFNITISSAQLIDGSATQLINTNWGTYRMVFTGSTWAILSKF